MTRQQTYLVTMNIPVSLCWDYKKPEDLKRTIASVLLHELREYREYDLLECVKDFVPITQEVSLDA